VASALPLLLAAAAMSLLVACKPEEEAKADAPTRPVRTVTISEKTLGNTVTLAGTIESQVQVDFGFRIGGRVTDRLESVGDQVEADEFIPGTAMNFGDVFGIIYAFTADGFSDRELRDYVDIARSDLLRQVDVIKRSNGSAPRTSGA
jgi:hypothetical protein